MSDIPVYERRPYLAELDTEVLTVASHEGRPYVLLDDTLFYPEGGGQPADRGHVGELAVLDVQRGEDGIRHFLAAAPTPGPVHLTLDWRRRFDHMQQHTAQHLLTAIAADRYGWQTTSFHLGAEVCNIELDKPDLTGRELERLEESVAEEIRADRPVTTRRIPRQAYDELPGVRSRGLPSGHMGDVRLVEIAGLDLNTCGGTHLAATAEIESLKLLGSEPLRGGTRLLWIAGGRVRHRLGAHEARNAELRKILGAADDDLAAIASQKLEQLKASQKRQRALARQLAESIARQLATWPEPIAEAHFEDAEPGFLQIIAKGYAGSDHPGLALLTADHPKGCFFVVVAGGGLASGGEILRRLGGNVAQALGGRGGGSGAIFQGKAPSLAGREDALDLLRREV